MLTFRAMFVRRITPGKRRRGWEFGCCSAPLIPAKSAGMNGARGFLGTTGGMAAWTPPRQPVTTTVDARSRVEVYFPGPQRPGTGGTLRREEFHLRSGASANYPDGCSIEGRSLLPRSPKARDRGHPAAAFFRLGVEDVVLHPPKNTPPGAKTPGLMRLLWRS